ncbi:hypothetical protein BKA57DRAFT_538288 [Linnemannia elongata]|nr:hypothetical protein BKA57DRAFT_538288 [Linnemannia elongata]
MRLKVVSNRSSKNMATISETWRATGGSFSRLLPLVALDAGISPHWCLGNLPKCRTPSTVLVDLNDLQPCNQKSWRRYVIGRFWILVRQNPGLVRLRLPHLGVMNDESPEYTIDSLSMLKNLKDLDLDGMLLDLTSPSMLLRHGRNTRVAEAVATSARSGRTAGLATLCHIAIVVVLLFAAMTPFPQLELLRVEGKLEFDEEDKSIALLEGLCPGLIWFWIAPVKDPTSSTSTLITDATSISHCLARTLRPHLVITFPQQTSTLVYKSVASGTESLYPNSEHHRHQKYEPARFEGAGPLPALKELKLKDVVSKLKDMLLKGSS